MRPGELVQVSYFIERSSYNPFDVLVESVRARKEVTKPRAPSITPLAWRRSRLPACPWT
jgi:hypothetical protein